MPLLLATASLLRTEKFTGEVVRVIDGDTIRVMHLSRAKKIRLADVDTPEYKQAFGTQAKQFTSDLVRGKEVSVKVEGLDRHGRRVAEVILPDGRSLNRELVRAGFAWWNRKYSEDNTLGQLEEEARTAKRGLWADPEPLPPWEFRKRQKALDEK